MNFKPNSTPQNGFVRWGWHLLIYYEIALSLIDVEFSTLII